MKKQYLISILGLAALSISFGNGFSIMTSSSNGTTSMEPTSSTSFSKEELSTIEEYEDEFSDYSIEQISAGSSHSAAVVNDGSGADGDYLYTWGDNSFGQLGLGNEFAETFYITTPAQVTSLPKGNIEQISLGGDYSAAIVNNEGTDKLYTWGDNEYGQLGLGEKGQESEKNINFNTPQEVTFNEMADGNIEQISMGGDHSAAVVNDGSGANGDYLYTWGRNNNGQLGLGDNDLKNVPTKGMKGDIEEISMGLSHSAMVINDGINDNLYTWGNNNNGQLGHEDNDLKNVPTKVMEGDIEQISMGGYHSAAIVGGDLYTWGSNSKGQLGLGTGGKAGDHQSIPQEVTFFNGKGNIKQISMGNNHSSAIVGKDLYTWGYNFNGQLGLGSEGQEKGKNIDFNTPQEVTKGLPDGEIKQISMGESHSAVFADGDLYTWGSNSKGQLGLGDKFIEPGDNYNTPQLVPTIFPYLTEISSEVTNPEGNKEIIIKYSFKTNLNVQYVDVNILAFGQEITIYKSTPVEDPTNVWEWSQNITMAKYGEYSYSLDLTYEDSEGKPQTIENIDGDYFVIKNPWLRPWGIVGISIVVILLIVIIFGALFYLINKYKKRMVK